MAAATLRSREWEVGYSHEDGDLVAQFFVPALERSQLYRRVTGYFSADVLALAARGLDALVQAGGRMELVVGCTLQPAEIEQIERGYSLRDVLARDGARSLELAIDEPQARQRLGLLSLLVAHGRLDIKLAVPKDEHGRFGPGLGLYHAKVGLLVDEAGDRLAFSGSINETEAGWVRNCESFTVSCSWWGEKDLTRVQRAEREFEALWRNRALRAEVVDFPEALRRELLKFLPASDDFVLPPKAPGPRPDADLAPTPAPRGELADQRAEIWRRLVEAPARPDNGFMVAIETSTVEPWPHQVRAYRRMLESWPCRLLIADEVGLGKTIEAGLLIKHAWIAGLARRILLLVPASVVKQWQAELYEKFNLLVPIYDGQALAWSEHHGASGPIERRVERSKWTQEPFVLASSHIVRRTDRRGELLDGPEWDLVVLDEAHHARRRGAGSAQERGPNQLLQLMEKLQARTRALLLLTATPMQVDLVEVYDLLRLLGLAPEWNEASFRKYFEELGANPGDDTLHRLARAFRLQYPTPASVPTDLVDRAMQRHGLSAVARRAVVAALYESSAIPIRRLAPEQRQALLMLLRLGSPLRARMSRHTRDLLREYRRAGLLDQPIAERKVDDLAIDLLPSERRVYQRVEDYISAKFQAAASDRKTAVGFIMTVYRRRMASSFHALRQTLERRLEEVGTPGRRATRQDWSEDVPDDDTADDSIDADEAAERAAAAAAVEEAGAIKALLRDIATLGVDSKAQTLIDLLQAEFRNGRTSAIVFTQYTDTMEYLRRLLTERIGDPIGCFSGRGGLHSTPAGGWSTCTKEYIKGAFKAGQIRVLVCTDAAGEGLNLQTCGLLVNYDLPWNPMRVEQRIGRIDRIGQRHPEIRIVNLGYRDTVEADVYFALSQRIGLFMGVVGRLQPILSRLPRRFEEAILAPAAQREHARRQLTAAVEREAEQAREGGFDLDAMLEGDLVPPALPAPPYSSEDIERVLRSPELLPPGVTCKPLDPTTFDLVLPDRRERLRVTSSPETFDEHFESHQLVGPDSPVFREMCRLAVQRGN